MRYEQSKRELFLELAKPDEYGFSRIVYIEEFVGKYERLQHTNGSDWGRGDGKLAKDYNLERIPEGNKIVAYQLNGFNKTPKIKSIHPDIQKHITRQRCAVLDISTKIECDHKDGRYDDVKFILKEDSIKDYQPLNRNVNLAKRQHCRKCKETNMRYDAKRLGYSVSQWNGDMRYKGSCTGCYWHDIRKFNQEVSKK